MTITEVTICLHCGCRPEIVKRQMEILAPLEREIKLFWNNRIDRHPGSYDSYSQLINDSIITSPTEHIILINDRTHPKPHEVRHILELLDQGFAAATKYSVGFLGVTKQLFRTIGWWDERYIGGGFEDDEFVLRLRAANLAYYESLEGEYDMDWKSPLRPAGGDACAKSEPFFHQKWRVEPYRISQVIPDESYPHYDAQIGPERRDIVASWLPWSASKVGIAFYQRPDQGPSRTHWFRTREGVEFRRVVRMERSVAQVEMVTPVLVIGDGEEAPGGFTSITLTEYLLHPPTPSTELILAPRSLNGAWEHAITVAAERPHVATVVSELLPPESRESLNRLVAIASQRAQLSRTV